MAKIAQALLQQLDQAPPEERMRVIVRYRRYPTADTARPLRGARVTAYRLLPFAAAEVTTSEAYALADDDNVEQMWPDLPVHIWLDVSVPLIGAPQVWGDGPRGKGVRVAVVDTGVDATHPDLAGRLILTQDFSGEGFQDNHGHGTHVAGIIGGNGTASNGKYIGVAPEVSLMAAKVLKGDGSGLTSDVMSGVEWAVENGAQVINLSLGSDGSCDGSDALSQMCDAAVGRGIVMCVAAGNAGPAPRTVGSPGCARQVITVGATDDSDRVAGFSSRGPTADERAKPDICFPGVSIASTCAHGTGMGQVVDAYYTTASGTSMATPHCAGAAALLLQAKPSLTPAEIKDALLASAKDLSVDANSQGRGRAQVYQAYLGNSTPPPEPPPPPTGNGCAQVVSRFWRYIPGGRP